MFLTNFLRRGMADALEGVSRGVSVLAGAFRGAGATLAAGGAVVPPEGAGV